MVTPIIDSDCHVIEPTQLWTDYLDAEFRERVIPTRSGFPKVDGQVVFEKISEQIAKESARLLIERHGDALSSGFDASSQVRAVREIGADLAFLYPTGFLYIMGLDGLDGEVSLALVRAYNRWLQDFCAEAPRTLHGVAAISLHAPETLSDQVANAVSMGWRAVVVRPNPIGGRTLSAPEYESLWSTCEDLDVSVSIHEGTHARSPTVGADRFETRFALHGCSHPMEQMLAVLALIEGGVLERHPRLRVAFLEGGVGWVPYWMWRLDEEYENLAWEVRENVAIRPSEYVRRQCYFSGDPGEPNLQSAIDFLGTERVLFGSDYPHMDHRKTSLSELMGPHSGLSSLTIERILSENPRRFYGI